MQEVVGFTGPFLRARITHLSAAKMRSDVGQLVTRRSSLNGSLNELKMPRIAAFSALKSHKNAYTNCDILSRFGTHQRPKNVACGASPSRLALTAVARLEISSNSVSTSLFSQSDMFIGPLRGDRIIGPKHPLACLYLRGGSGCAYCRQFCTVGKWGCGCDFGARQLWRFDHNEK